MKFSRVFSFMFLKLSAVALALFAVNVSEAQTNSVRLAVVPFFAPPGNGDIQQIAASAPDLLMVELSHDNRFQLVEREKVNAIWSELNLAESGFVSADTVEKFGRILSCDWLVSGSIVQVETSTQIWVKVIDVQSGVVLDLQEFPYSVTNFSATISAISDFVAQINPRSQPRQFIALGNFADMSISSTRADLSHRLPTLIEKHFLAAGFGVVEREAVASIFSEFQLEWAGLIEDSTNRVKLKPAFWIMDGECKWVYDTQDKISVAMRVKKVGGGEQIFRFTKPPGDELDKAVLEAVQSALANTNQIALDEAEIQESKLLDAHAKELANGRGMTWVPSRYTTNVPPPVVFTVHDQNGRKMTFTNQSQDRPVYENAYYQNGMRDMLNTLKQAILLNTNDMNAKYRLGFYLVHSADPVEKQQGGDLLKEVAASSDESAKFLMGKALLSAYPDAAQKQQGMDLLKEVAASSDATNAADAKLWLTSFEQTGHGPVWHPPGVSVQAMMTNLAISFAQDIEITNIADKAGSFVQIPSPPATGYFEGITAVKFWQGKVLIASGTTLQSYDSETESTVEIKLPLKLEHRITTIEADENDLWLGTEGGGLVRLSKAGGVPRVFSEKDGFPMPSITALRLMQGRLLIGFGFHESGAFGYLDTDTEKFTGLMSEVSAFKSWQDAVQNPPETSIGAINIVDETNIWVSSGRALQRFDFGSKEWNLALPDAPGDIQNVSLNSSFMAAIVPFRCVAISKQPGNQWTCLNLSTDYDQNLASTLALDTTAPNLLWIGRNHGKVTILNMATSKIIGECKLGSLGEVKWIFDNSDSMIFLVSDLVYGSYDLYCLKKSGHSETNQETASSGGQAETGQKTAPSEGQITEDKWAEAMQEYFPKFVPVQFQKDENGRAILQQLHIKENAFGSPGNYYCGFRFTAPSWNDGDFECVYALIKTEAEKDFFSQDFWGIISEHGPLLPEDAVHFHHDDLADYSQLQRQFPYSHSLTFMEANGLEPGKNYAVWFHFSDTNRPDIAFAMTIKSNRGTNEFGMLPLTSMQNLNLQPVTTKDPPLSAEQLRSELETALKAKDENAVLSLVNWQGVSDENSASPYSPVLFSKLQIHDVVMDMLGHEIASVRLLDLPGALPRTNEVNGIRYRPNIPCAGLILVRSTDRNWSQLLAYGKQDNAFYIPIGIREKIETLK